MSSDRWGSQAYQEQLVSDQVQTMLAFQSGDAFRGGSVLHSAVRSGSTEVFEAILAVPEVRCGLLRHKSVLARCLCPTVSARRLFRLFRHCIRESGIGAAGWSQCNLKMIFIFASEEQLLRGGEFSDTNRKNTLIVPFVLHFLEEFWIIRRSGTVRAASWFRVLNDAKCRSPPSMKSLASTNHLGSGTLQKTYVVSFLSKNFETVDCHREDFVGASGGLSNAGGICTFHLVPKASP